MFLLNRLPGDRTSLGASSTSAQKMFRKQGCQMAIARFLDRMCLALRASGLWLRYATLQNLIPSFPWIAPPRPPPWRNPRKGRDQILPSGNPVRGRRGRRRPRRLIRRRLGGSVGGAADEQPHRGQGGPGARRRVRLRGQELGRYLHCVPDMYHGSRFLSNQN